MSENLHEDSRNKIKSLEQRKAYKSALKEEFINNSDNSDETNKECLPSFASYTKTSKILCKFCKTESLNYLSFQIHLKSKQHVDTVKIIRDSYNKQNLIEEKRNLEKIKKIKEDETNLLSKRQGRGTMYMDEKIEILDTEYKHNDEMNNEIALKAGLMHKLPLDFFDDGIKRKEFIKEESKNIKSQNLEKYKEITKNEQNKFMEEARKMDIELNCGDSSSNFADKIEPENLYNINKEFNGSITTTTNSKFMINRDIKYEGSKQSENLLTDRVIGKLELMKQRINERKQRLQ